MKKCPFCGEKIQKDAIKCKHCGEWSTLPIQPIDLPNTIEKEVPMKRIGCFQLAGILFGVIVILTILGGIFGDNGSDSVPQSCISLEGKVKMDCIVENKKASLQTVCQMSIIQSLKSPSSAEFGNMSNILTNDKNIQLNPYVDSENSFGAKIRTNFHCLFGIKNGVIELESIDM